MANRILRGHEPAVWSSAAIALATACTVGIGPAKAATDLSAGLAIGVERDTNPLGVSQSQAQALEASGAIKGQEDTARRMTANLAAVSGANSPLYMQFTSLYTRVDYTNIDTLNHSEYNFAGNLDWKPSRIFDTSLHASQIRAPVALNDIGGSQTVQQTSRQADATLRLRTTPNWQLSLTPSWYNFKLPLPGTDTLELRESSGTAQVDYLGVGRLVPGVLVKEARGKYYGVQNATRYREQSAGIALNYKVTDFSSFSLFAGYMRRNTHLVQPSNDPLLAGLEGKTSGFAGNLSYQRQLSVKTSISISAFRDFQQYDAGVNTTVGTGVDAGITWKPTAKLSTTLNAGLVRQTIDGLQVAQSDERTDLERHFSLSLKYLVTRHINMRTYVARHLHDSTLATGVFNQTVAGLELSANFD